MGNLFTDCQAPGTAESNDAEKSAGNLSDLLVQVSKNSTGEIDSLIGDLRHSHAPPEANPSDQPAHKRRAAARAGGRRARAPDQHQSIDAAAARSRPQKKNKAKQSLENRVRRLEDLVQRYEPPLPLLEAEKRQREQEEGGNT